MTEHKIDAVLTPEEKATLAGLVSVYPGIKDFVAGVIDRLSEGRLDEMLEHLTKSAEDKPELMGDPSAADPEAGPGNPANGDDHGEEMTSL